VMHFNENHKRPQATLSDGSGQWRVEYPKGKAGEHTVRVRRTAMSFGMLNGSILLGRQFIVN
jgi:hypothetical protein